MAVVTENSAIMDVYYDERALSSLPGKGWEPYFQLGQIQWAFDLIENVDSGPSVIDPIPTDLDALQNVFLTNDAVYSYANGAIIISASIAPGEINEGENYAMSAIGILDSNSNLSLAIGVLPIYVHNGRGIDVTIMLRTAKDGTISISTSIKPR